MKKSNFLKVCVLLLLVSINGAFMLNAQDATAKIAGKWQATWNTGIGTMNNTYTFIVNGDVLTGKVVTEIDNQKEESDITEGKINGDVVTFTNLYQGTVKMVYTGKIAGDEIKFTRDAGGFATEEAVAKRLSDTK
jgi:hypothetical protein